MKRACIFCASSDIVSESYFRAAAETSRQLVAAGWGIVYGGGSKGLMGAVADSALAAGGSVTGVIPKFMVEVEWQHKGVADMRQTETMSERKELMMSLSDAIIAMPGGTGTLDELFEAMADKKLGLFGKPLVLLNTDGFYDATIAQIERMVSDGFMTRRHAEVLSVATSAEEVIALIDKEEQPLNLIDAAVH